MFKLPCPACGADVVFQSTASVYAVCPFCKTAAVRRDLDLRAYGSMADVQLDATPLQLNTRGHYGGKTFTLIGRLRVGWENGFWNEWSALFSDNRIGWLAEAQGFYAMSFESYWEDEIPEYKSLFSGHSVRLKPSSRSIAIPYQVDDMKRATCLGSEGELPFPALVGRQAVSVDLSTATGGFASIEYTEAKRRVFFGQYVEFDAFDFSFLRELDGW